MTVPRSTQSGMTLLEIMIAMAIMMAMLGMAWSSFSQGLQIKNQSESINERFHEIRVAMSRMVDDLSAAYISGNEVRSSQNPRTLFVGKAGGDVDELRFTSLAHRVLWADADESSQTMISYSAEDDVEDSSKTNLIRRESRRLTKDQWERKPADTEVLLRDIQGVRFEHYDWKQKEWRGSWNTTKPDGQRGRLPTRVRITIELKNKRGDEVKFFTQARIMMQEELRFVPN